MANLDLSVRPQSFQQPLSLSAFTCLRFPALLQPCWLPCCPPSPPGTPLPQDLCTAHAAMARSLAPSGAVQTPLPLSLSSSFPSSALFSPVALMPFQLAK